MKNNKTLAHAPRELLGDLRARFDAVQERFADIYGEANKSVAAASHSADTALRGHLYRSLAIALGVGLLAGMVIGWRRK